MKFLRAIALAVTLGSASAQSTTSGTAPCATVSQILASHKSAQPKETAAAKPARFDATIALACLESVPLDVNRSQAYVEYVMPFIEFQATIEILKNPPTGYTVPGVDILGGLNDILTNLGSDTYSNQWSFEKDLFNLVNILPHDFHLNLPVPLVNLFTFGTFQQLVSVSVDGTQTPKVYLKSGLDSLLTSNSTVSSIVSIDGMQTVDYLMFLGQTTSEFSDADAIYNQIFYSIPLAQAGRGELASSGTYYGFTNSSTVFKFENGSTASFPNYATTNQDFSQIQSGADLFSVLEIPPTASSSSNSSESTSMTSATASSSSGTATASSSTIPLISGYPQPEVVHSQGYTAGFFLNNTDIAVLAISSFESRLGSSITSDQEQQEVITKFLALCSSAGKKKLIVDLSANGGGSIFNGYDAFTQIFPTTVPYGATRFRQTPALEYLEGVLADYAQVDKSFTSELTSFLDVNLEPFPSVQAFGGPFELLGDNFTAETRYNLSDVAYTERSSGLVITGYANRSTTPPQVFSAEDIVLLYDGSCGSTCSIFAEFMRGEVGVRSIVLGGRPQLGPMQGIGGSKAAQVETYQLIQDLFQTADLFIQEINNSTSNSSIPSPPPKAYRPSQGDPPLGLPLAEAPRYSFSLRNNYAPDDSTTPLQFIYEAANCRLFYTVEDVYSMVPLWKRVANVAWGNGTCVSGSTVNSDGTTGNGTVPFSPNVVSNVTIPQAPGVISSNAGNGTGSGSNGTTTSTPTAPPQANKSSLGTSVLGNLKDGLAFWFVLGLVVLHLKFVV